MHRNPTLASPALGRARLNRPHPAGLARCQHGDAASRIHARLHLVRSRPAASAARRFLAAVRDRPWGEREGADGGEEEEGGGGKGKDGGGSYQLIVLTLMATRNYA